MVFEKTQNESCCLRFISVGWSDRDGCNLIGIRIRSRMVKLSIKYRFRELLWHGCEMCLWLAILENDE